MEEVITVYINNEKTRQRFSSTTSPNQIYEKQCQSLQNVELISLL